MCAGVPWKNRRLVVSLCGLMVAGCGASLPLDAPGGEPLAATESPPPLTDYLSLDMREFSEAVSLIQFSQGPGRRHLNRRYRTGGRLTYWRTPLAGLFQFWNLRIDDPATRAWAPLITNKRFITTKQAQTFFEKLGAAPVGTALEPVTVFVTMRPNFLHFNGTQAVPYDACRLDAVTLTDGSVIRP